MTVPRLDPDTLRAVVELRADHLRLAAAACEIEWAMTALARGNMNAETARELRDDALAELMEAAP